MAWRLHPENMLSSDKAQRLRFKLQTRKPSQIVQTFSELSGLASAAATPGHGGSGAGPQASRGSGQVDWAFLRPLLQFTGSLYFLFLCLKNEGG